MINSYEFLRNFFFINKFQFHNSGFSFWLILCFHHVFFYFDLISLSSTYDTITTLCLFYMRQVLNMIYCIFFFKFYLVIWRITFLFESFYVPGLDVVRTDRTLVFYEKQEHLSKLWDILAVYAWIDTDVGYCQGG